MHDGRLHQGRRWAVAGALGLALGLSAPGCRTPQGYGVYDSTPADRAAREAFDPGLLTFCDQVAEALIADVSELPEIRGAATRKVLALGALVNETATPTADFESIQARIRGRLLRSERIRADFLVVQDPAITRRDRARLVGGQEEDLLQEGAGAGSDVDVYAAADTYALQGQFWERSRSGGGKTTQRFYLTFSLVNLQTNAIVFSSDYDLAQSR